MKVLVLGDQCVDKFVYGVSKRICPEGPVPVFNPIETKENPGMAGNVAANIRALGVEVDLISNTESVTKTRLVDKRSNHLHLRIDENDKVERIKGIDEIDFNIFSALVVSDYDKGFLTIEDLLLLSSKHDCTFIDTKKVLGAWAKGFTFIKINESEYEICKQHPNNLEELQEKLIVTLSERGAFYKGQTYPLHEYHNIYDVSGAGDSFLAALVVDYLKTNDIKHAIHFANDCASIVVQKKGVSTI